MKAAIVCTLKDASPTLETFIRYHLQIGFEHIYLFFDDPEDPAIKICNSNPRITALKNDSLLHNKWQKSILYPQLEKYISTDIMARQQLNLMVARDLAIASSFDWLLHIDIDELFFLRGQNLNFHLNYLDSKKIKSVNYLNFEAVPEKFQYQNYFMEADLFKVNKLLLNSPAKKLLSFLDSGDKIISFNSYENGKSIARLDKYLIPQGVHLFNRTAYRNANFPLILHYPFMNPESLISRFKNFRDTCLDYKLEEKMPLYARLKKLVNNYDETKINEFYENNIIIQEELRDILLKSGIFVRINPIKSAFG